MNFKHFTFLIFAFLIIENTSAQNKSIDVLVFSKTERNRHESIPAGKEALTKMGSKNQWVMSFSEDGNVFTINELSKYDVIVFLNTTGNVLSDDKKKRSKVFLH